MKVIIMNENTSEPNISGASLSQKEQHPSKSDPIPRSPTATIGTSEMMDEGSSASLSSLDAASIRRSVSTGSLPAKLASHSASNTDRRNSSASGGLVSPLVRHSSNPTPTRNSTDSPIRGGILVTRRQSESVAEIDGKTSSNSVAAAMRKLRRQQRIAQLAGGNGGGDGRLVKFDQVEIREYPITVGDNPGGYIGPPLTIEWEYVSRASLLLEDYEASRPARRVGSEMSIPNSVRQEMLQRSGLTRGEIQSFTKLVNIARNQRKRTVEQKNVQGIHEIAEKVRRGTKNILIPGRKKKERAFLKNAMNVHNQSLEGPKPYDDALKENDDRNEQPDQQLLLA